jgi:hypothetical protein
MEVPMSELGRMYLDMIKQGKICGCELYSGRKCDKCLERERIDKINKQRASTIKRIKNKIKS